MVKEFSDPIHGFIRAYPHELKLIDSFYLQRLRHIKQLGVCYLVFPSAQHTRFEHSLGVMHLAGELYKALGYTDEKLYRIVRLAGLLHDVGHPPFSHTTEVLLGDKDHEKLGKSLVLERMADMLREDFSFEDMELVCRIAFKEPKNDEEKKLSQIVVGDLGADRMDYLRRDAYFCGTSYGLFDYGRILSHLRHQEGKLCVSYSAVTPLENFFLGRYFMYAQVYFHKVVRILSIHLNELIKSMKDADLHFSTDAEFISYCMKNYEDEKVRRIFGREHYREVYTTTDEKEFAQVKEFLLEKYPEELLRFDVCKKRLMDEEVWVERKEDLVRLRDVSQILANVKDLVICRVYAHRDVHREITRWFSKAQRV